MSQVQILSPRPSAHLRSRLVGATVSVISQFAVFRRSLGIGTNPVAPTNSLPGNELCWHRRYGLLGLIGRAGGDSSSTCHSCWHDSQTRVRMTTGRSGTVATLRATPSPVAHAGHGRRTDIGMGEPRPKVTRLTRAVVTPANHGWKSGAVLLTRRERRTIRIDRRHSRPRPSGSAGDR